MPPSYSGERSSPFSLSLAASCWIINSGSLEAALRKQELEHGDVEPDHSAPEHARAEEVSAERAERIDETLDQVKQASWSVELSLGDGESTWVQITRTQLEELERRAYDDTEFVILRAT